MVVPGGWRPHAILSTDDTFTPGTSQLYLYLAARESHLWRDKGSLWCFQVTRTDEGPVDPRNPFNDANDYLDIQSGDDWRGRFIRVPRKITLGQTDLPPQDALEAWSNKNNVFQFIRLEDLAYDDHNSRVVYVADTGASRIIPDPATGRMQRPITDVGLADNGRIFRFEFNERNPRKVDSFSVFADGDVPADSPVYVDMTSPDNVDTSPNSLMVQEDTANAKILRHDFATGDWSVVATVNDPAGESSGIVDASEWFGEGTWLSTVQAHSTFVDREVVDGLTITTRGRPVAPAGAPGVLIAPGHAVQVCSEATGSNELLNTLITRDDHQSLVGDLQDPHEVLHRSGRDDTRRPIVPITPSAAKITRVRHFSADPQQGLGQVHRVRIDVVPDHQ